MKTILYALLLGAFVCVHVASAQEAQGYSAIDWDASSSTVIGYSETDLDDNVQAYYQAEVWAYILDQNGNQLATATRVDKDNNNNGVISVVIQVPGQYNMTYTIHGHHRGMPFYSSGGSCYESNPALPIVNSTPANPNCESDGGPDDDYDDFYNFESFGGLDTRTYWGDFFGPGPENDTPDPTIEIMSTQDSASVTTNCGDDRDKLMQEYATYNIAGLGLTCAAFTTGHSTPYFAATDLLKCCPSHPNQEFAWILQSQEYIGMITAWYAQISFPVNSAYRDPVQNQQCGGAMPPQNPSRHMFGDAMDAGNPSHDPNNWQKLHDAVYPISDFQEPITGPCKLGCVHGDMRLHGPHYF